VNADERPGKGITAECEKHGRTIGLGSKELLEELGVSDEFTEKAEEMNRETGYTLLFVIHGREVIGSLSLADSLKPTSKQAVSGVKDLGLKPILLTGDNRLTAGRVASELGIEDFIAEVLPEDKQNEIKKLQKKGAKVSFIGDGINDAPALVQADLGISLASGTDIAKEAGEIILMKNDPLLVPDAIRLSRKTFSIIKQNLFWAFFYNSVAIPIAVLGLANPMIGAVAMTFSDITVIANSMRIYRK